MDTDELAFLRAVPCFQGLRTKDLLQVHRCARRREPRAGEIIVRAGERSATLYLVRRGSVRLFITSVEGTEQGLAVQGAGTTFNEAAVCDGGPSLATARALTADTCIDEIPAVLVSHLLTAYPRLARNIVQVLAQHIRRLALLVDERSREGSG